MKKLKRMNQRIDRIFIAFAIVTLVFCMVFPILARASGDIGKGISTVFIKDTTSGEDFKSIKKLAQSKLDDLLATGYWEHTNSNGCDYNCRTKEYTENGQYSWVGENLYRGICSEDNAYRLWKLSPTHKEILDHESDEEVLVSGSYGENLCYYVLEKGVLK